ncbi:MAG: serine hydrolase domain-containing protein [Gordonia sp. (in: high G+C Gram-positive bacteria)]
MTDLASQLQAYLDDGHEHGLFSGAAIAVRTPSSRSTAYAGTHAYDDATAVTSRSLFDLASVSKTFVATILVRLIEQGIIDPDEPVAQRFPISVGDAADRITVRMLLSHTSGLPAEASLWRNPDVPHDERLSRVLATGLETPPGETFRYSCVGYVAAGALAEHLTGTPLPQLLSDYVTTPLALADTTYGPVSASAAVATENQPYLRRGMVRGEVHDELNWYLGGRVGNAGIFSTAPDLLAFAESVLDHSLLGHDAYRLMTTNTLTPAHGAGFGHSLGLRLGDPGFMGGIRGFGHTGFTGTMWVVDPRRETVVVLLTNRVHPHRDRVDLSAYRRGLCDLVASAVDGTQISSPVR